MITIISLNHKRKNHVGVVDLYLLIISDFINYYDRAYFVFVILSKKAGLLRQHAFQFWLFNIWMD